MKLVHILVLAALGVVGCDDKGDDTGSGGDGGSAEVQPTCEGAFTACGGDAVGSWTAADLCFDLEIDGIPDCPDATYEYDASMTGTLAVDAAGTYAVASVVTVDLTATIPKTCVGEVTCEQVSAGSGMDCTDTGDACACTRVEETDNSETGTWTAAGSTLTLVTDGSGETTTAEYCATTSYMQLLFTMEEGEMRMILSR